MRCSATTLAGAPCRNAAMLGAELCSTHLHPRAGREPRLLTPGVTDAIVTALRAGNYVTVACRAAGISRQSFGEWMRRGAAASSGVYHDFHGRVEKAKAEGEVRNVALISQAAKESWTAAAWLLERMYPERWGRVSTQFRLGEPAEAPVTTEHDPFEEVDELAEARRRRAPAS